MCTCVGGRLQPTHPIRHACVDPTKVTFQDFCLNYQWLQHTVEAVLAKYQPNSAALTAKAGWSAVTNGWHQNE